MQNEHLLIEAIIGQAIKDYKYNPSMRLEIESFIKSDWFAVLTDLDPDLLLNHLKKIIKR